MDSPGDILRREFEFYLQHQAEIVAQYDGKVIVLKQGEVIGVYDTDGEAVTATAKEHELGTFLVQRVSEGKEAYTQVFHSRART